jgi:hypothetical protein
MNSIEEIVNQPIGYEKYLDFKCIGCGEKLPTVMRKERRGNIEYGDYTVNIEYYDTSKEAYFVRLDNSEFLKNQYKILTDKLITSEKNQLKREIETNVLKEDFRRLVEGSLSEKIDTKFKYKLENFQRFLYWFDRPFERRFPQPRYTLDLLCASPILKSTEGLEKQKYVIENGEEKILRCKAKIDINKFSKTFAYLSNYFDLNSIASGDNLILEFWHFSEFPLVEA